MLRPERADPDWDGQMGGPDEGPAAGDRIRDGGRENNAENGPGAGSGQPYLGTTVIRRRRKGVTTAVLLATTALALALVAVLITWWSATPSSPVTDLGLRTADGAGEVEGGGELIDAEQSAFLERRGGAALEGEDGAGGTGNEATFTDTVAVLRLAGAWTFDLGGAPSQLGGPEPLVGVLGSEVVKRQEREHLTLELFQVLSRDLPSYYTILALPEGRFMTFQGEDGVYRYVLEDVRIHGEDIFSYRLGSSSRRRYAHRLSEEGLRGGDAPRSSDEPRLRSEEPDRPPVVIRREPDVPVDALWQQGRALMLAERYHSLDRLLDRILRRQPDHGPARRWKEQIPRWIDEQERMITGQVRSRLGELVGGLADRDLERVLAQWGGQADRPTRAFFERRIETYPRIRVWARLLEIEVRDGEAKFSATLTLEGQGGGRNRGRRSSSIEEIPWRARFENGVFVGSFPGS
jgi:hypothetical protein